MNTSNPSVASVGSVKKSDQSEQSNKTPSAAARPPSSLIGAAKTETPKLPQSLYESPHRTRDDVVPIGNRKYEMTLKLEGKLGLFLHRERTSSPEVDVPLNSGNYCRSILDVLRHVLNQQHRIKKDMADEDFRARVDKIAATLTQGVAVMTYLKLRSLNLSRPDVAARFMRKPRVPQDFVVPAPYAYAISQLGAIEASSLTSRKIYFPVVTAARAPYWAYSEGTPWSQPEYAEAVEIAQSMGLVFSKVDLSVKVGSAWWLFNPKEADGITSLSCILPEDNYTEAAAAVNSLFMNNGGGRATNEIFNLSSLDQVDYGTFIRTSGSDISYATFYGMGGAVNERAWKSED